MSPLSCSELPGAFMSDEGFARADLHLQTSGCGCKTEAYRAGLWRPGCSSILLRQIVFERANDLLTEVDPLPKWPAHDHDLRGDYFGGDLACRIDLATNRSLHTASTDPLDWAGCPQCVLELAKDHVRDCLPCAVELEQIRRSDQSRPYCTSPLIGWRIRNTGQPSDQDSRHVQTCEVCRALGIEMSGSGIQAKSSVRRAFTGEGGISIATLEEPDGRGLRFTRRVRRGAYAGREPLEDGPLLLHVRSESFLFLLEDGGKALVTERELQRIAEADAEGAALVSERPSPADLDAYVTLLSTEGWTGGLLRLLSRLSSPQLSVPEDGRDALRERINRLLDSSSRRPRWTKGLSRTVEGLQPLHCSSAAQRLLEGAETGWDSELQRPALAGWAAFDPLSGTATPAPLLLQGDVHGISLPMRRQLELAREAAGSAGLDSGDRVPLPAVPRRVSDASSIGLAAYVAYLTNAGIVIPSPDVVFLGSLEKVRDEYRVRTQFADLAARVAACYEDAGVRVFVLGFPTNLRELEARETALALLNHQGIPVVDAMTARAGEGVCLIEIATLRELLSPRHTEPGVWRSNTGPGD